MFGRHNTRGYALAALLLTSICSPTTSFTPTVNNKNIQTTFRPNQLHAATIEAPVRKPETPERVQEVRERFRTASIDAANASGCAKDSDGSEWWRTPEDETYRQVTNEKPLRVIITGGGVAGLVTAAACHAKGMKVAIFEQASQYAPYGGPIQIQSNALRALERINPKIFEEIEKAGTITADRVSGLKIGYKKGVFLGLGKQYEKGDWLVRFDTLQPALQAGLAPTRVVDRPVIQQILLNHGIPEGTVRIKSRIRQYEELGEGKGLKVSFIELKYIEGLFHKYVSKHVDCVREKVTLEDGTVAYADVLVGADGIWSSVRRQMHGLETNADGLAASGAAGGALDEAEARRMAKESVLMADSAGRRYSGFTCYAALSEHKASNIEEVSYQILLGKDKYFVSTDGGGERQQW